MRPLVVLCALVALLVTAAPAGAHAFLVRSEPVAGGVVQTAPRALRLFFSEAVEPAPGITVVRAGGIPVTAGTPFVPAGNPREIVVPLQQGLGNGPYAVRWSEVDQEDGHVISGAFVFAVGGGLPPIQSAPSATETGGNPSASSLISRWLLLAGLLLAAGTFGFRLLVAPLRTDAVVLASALAVATLGAVLAVVLEPGGTGTRFGRRMAIGAGVAGVAALLALASRRVPRLLPVGGVLAVVLLALPTATGHASASGASHALSIPADLAHLAAAALWIAGVLGLVLAPRERRGELVRRFTPFAAGAVLVVGASGILRAYDEFASVGQLWSTGYGQALLVKTFVLGAVVALAWANRGRFRRLALGLEMALLAVVVGAVAVLINVRPGVARALAAAPGDTQTVVYAGQDDDLAVGLAVTPRDERTIDLRATVLGRTGPRSGLGITFGVDGRSVRAAACGAGCYRASAPVDRAPGGFILAIDGRSTMGFGAPETWPAPQALDLVRKAERAITSLRTLVVHSQLASDAGHAVSTTYKMVAPDRLEYRNVGGSDAVLIGNHRWDREPGKAWVESPQFPPIRQPAPFWPTQITDAHVVRTAQLDGRSTWVVTFLDPATPAWFTVWIDKTSYRTLQLEMVAAAHFMHDRDGPFNAPITVDAPAS